VQGHSQLVPRCEYRGWGVATSTNYAATASGRRPEATCLGRVEVAIFFRAKLGVLTEWRTERARKKPRSDGKASTVIGADGAIVSGSRSWSFGLVTVQRFEASFARNRAPTSSHRALYQHTAILYGRQVRQPA
jgi:hypothetical protein